MADNKMLIDATHPEETRVVVLRGGRVEEFDYESAARKLLRGNIYLAKVTRVEPALQAAFVDYGGNRHGFLAFNEIHPDYYQIPMADRQALIEEEVAAAIAHNDDDIIDDDSSSEIDAVDDENNPDDYALESNHDDSFDEDAQAASDDENDSTDNEADPTPKTLAQQSASDPILTESVPDATGLESEDSQVSTAHAENDPNQEKIDTNSPSDDIIQQADEPANDAENDIPHEVGLVEDQGVDEVGGNVVDEHKNSNATNDFSDTETDGEDDGEDDDSEADSIDEVGSDDALEEVPQRPRRSRRSYKIQEVIKRRQILLIQVVKEERGTKGAALTTYLSLAGRYTVLMPNTARGGGVSRKISSPQDRKRMKAIAAELDVPDGMGLIIRTAGASRTKQEIRRDFEYLLRLWENVRELTLESTAPSLVYEEGDLIKRSIRDLYNKEVDEVVVAGVEAHKEAKAFMKMLMPSHTRNVTLYDGAEPLFTRYQIERQLNAMFTPQVPLRSGGYLVINQTEALVAVDVNSGRSTREFSIEETALHTNLEAADEVARQLKLRDLAGLIVIDFIDMDEKRNNRAVERRMKDVLRDDRARIQVGHISHFGLLEMSRQRMRTGVLEGSTSPCQHCQGTGTIRSTESVALAVLRGLEDAVMAGSRSPLVTQAPASVALYILNSKRAFVEDMERRLGQPITIQISDTLVGANFTIEKGSAAAHIPGPSIPRSAVNMDAGFANESSTESPSGQREQRRTEKRDDSDQPKRRRRRGRRSREDANFDERNDTATDDADVDAAAVSDNSENVETSEREDASNEGTRSRNRRRGRRGGRRNRERRAASESPINETNEDTESLSNGNDDQSANDNVTPDGLGPQPDFHEPDSSNDGQGEQPLSSTAESEHDENRRPRRPRRSRSGGRSRNSHANEAGDSAATPIAEKDGGAQDDANSEQAAKIGATASTDDAATSSDELASPRPRRSTTPDSSPADIQIQSIKVGTANNGSDSDEAGGTITTKTEEKRSSRTGWWQRRLMGND